MTTTLICARASTSTPPVSTSPRERSIRDTQIHKAKLKECTFLTSLSDLDNDFDHTSSSSYNEVKNKLNGLCFFANTTWGLCTMALGEDAVSDNSNNIGDDSKSEVSLSTDELTTKVDELMAS